MRHDSPRTLKSEQRARIVSVTIPEEPNKQDYRSPEAFVHCSKLSAIVTVISASRQADIDVEMSARTITCSISICAPDDRRGYEARLIWLLQQLPRNLPALTSVRVLARGTLPKTALVSALRADPGLARPDNPRVAPTLFEISVATDLAGRVSDGTAIIETVEDAVLAFHDAIVHHIRDLQPAPRCRPATRRQDALDETVACGGSPVPRAPTAPTHAEATNGSALFQKVVRLFARRPEATEGGHSNGRDPDTLSAHAPAREAGPAPASTEPSRSNEACPAVRSVIGENVTVVGTIESSGDLRLNGTVKGDVRARNLLLGTSGRIVGRALADHLQVEGRIDGTIRGGRVTLREGSHVAAEMHYQTLVVDEGARLEGQSRPSEDTTQERKCA